jgi:hypothetical protein
MSHCLKRRRKITPEQQHELLQVYLHMGHAASAELSVEYGVSPKYASSIAASVGMGRPKWRAGNRYKDSNTQRATRSHSDPRWALAIERGAVSA